MTALLEAMYITRATAIRDAQSDEFIQLQHAYDFIMFKLKL